MNDLKTDLENSAFPHGREQSFRVNLCQESTVLSRSNFPIEIHSRRIAQFDPPECLKASSTLSRQGDSRPANSLLQPDAVPGRQACGHGNQIAWLLRTLLTT